MPTDTVDWLNVLGFTTDMVEEIGKRFEENPDAAQEFLTKAIHDAVGESASLLTKSLKRAAPSMLKQDRAYQAGFEHRLGKTWKKPFDLYDIVMTVCRDAGASLNERYRPEAAVRQDLVFEALTLVHARASLITSEIRALIFSGHPFGAHARWRALHELAVIAFVLPTGGADIAERFLLHQHVESLKDAEVYQTYCQRLGQTPFSDAEMRVMRENVQALKARYGPVYNTDWGWAAPLVQQPKGPPSFSDVENLAALNHLRPYYRWATKAVHIGSKSVADGRIKRGPHMGLLAGPINTGLADPAQGSLLSFGQVTSVYLLYGWEQLHDLTYIVIPFALMELVDQAAHAFVDVQHEIEEKERQLWTEPTASQPGGGGYGRFVREGRGIADRLLDLMKRHVGSDGGDLTLADDGESGNQ